MSRSTYSEEVAVHNSKERPKDAIPSQSPAWLVILLMLSIFIIEAVSHTIALFISPLSKSEEAILDSALLIAMLSPMLYFFMLRPLNQFIAQRKRVEADLLLFRNLINQSNDAIFIIDPETSRFQDFNDAACYNLGYKREELLNMKVIDIEVVIQDDSTWKEHVAEVRKKGSMVLEGRHRRIDGTLLPVEVNVKFIALDKKKYMIAVVRDLTERKRLEEALRENEEKYRLLYNDAPIAYMSIGSDGHILMVNRRVVEMLGYSENDLLGREVFDLYADTPAGKEKARELFMRFLAGKEIKGEELEMRRKDGVPVWVSLTVQPILDKEGHVAESRSVAEDITERKRIEDALHESEARYRMLFESAGDAIFIIEAEEEDAGRIIAANKAAAEMHGYTVDELVNMKITDLDAPEAAEYAPERIRRMLKGEWIKAEIDHRRKDGTMFPVEIIAGLFEPGKHKHILAFDRDITERKQVEEKLKQTMADLTRSNTELEQFAYVASHDLQEPLRMVANFTQLLEKRYKGKLDKDADEFIGFVVDGTTRMQRMINDLLAYSRVGTRGKSFEPIDCEIVFNEAIANLKLAIEGSGAAITHDHLPTITADGSQMVQLLQNLLSNAIKFCKEKPHVHVSAKQAGNDWVFSVKDNGIGIAPEFFDRLFQIFQRQYARSEYPGTGIGLAICKKIVERHGGRIWVESEPGKGSTFYFTIPVGKGK